MLDNLNKYRILLASKSPRRQELLHQMQIPFNAVAIDGIDESFPENLPVDRVALYISQKKAAAYSHLVETNELVITADTIVICGDEILGKPVDDQDAERMLMCLSDKWHSVTTGVSITTKDKVVSFDVSTKVKFAALTPEEAKYYVSTFKPLDKAGAYGIQEWIGAVAVERIDGSFYNVMGLPIHQLYNALKRF